jgi:hypothetical protein
MGNCFFGGDLDYTPFGLQAHRRLTLRAFCALRNAQGATLLALLESKLSDSAALRYLRRRSLCELRCKGGKILSSPPKKKNTEHPNGYSVFCQKDR